MRSSNVQGFVSIEYKIEKIKMAGPVLKYQVQWTRIMMNTRLDSSLRIKTRIRTELT